MAKDYYKILGVSRDASQKEIKKAYRRLAHKHHPDKDGGDSDKFKKINEAYQVLSDEKKRAQYDKFGQVFSGQGGQRAGYQNAQRGGFDFGGMNWQQAAGGGGGWSDIFEDIFNQFGGRTQRRKRQTYVHGSDIELAHTINLEDAFNGVQKTLKYKTFVNCKKCNGLGYNKGAGFKKCSKCQGQGEIREKKQTFFGQVSQIKTCPECRGKGKIPKDKCSACNGQGRVKGNREVNIDIKPGIKSGQVIKVKGAGEAGERGGKTGDLYVVINIKPHSRFKRKGDDLYIEKDIKITKALLGKSIDIKGISGETFEAKVPSGFNFKDDLKIKSKGMPKFDSNSKRGNLYVSFNTKIPKNLSKKAKDLLKKLDKEL